MWNSGASRSGDQAVIQVCRAIHIYSEQLVQ